MKDVEPTVEELDDNMILPSGQVLVPANANVKEPDDGQPAPIPQPRLPHACIIGLAISNFEKINNNQVARISAIVQQRGPEGIARVWMEIFEKHFIFDFDRLFDTAPQSPLPYREEWIPVMHPAPGGAIKPLWQQKALQDCPKRPLLIQFLFPMAAIQGKTIKVFAYAQCCDQQNMNDKTRVEQVYVVR